MYTRGHTSVNTGVRVAVDMQLQSQITATCKIAYQSPQAFITGKHSYFFVEILEQPRKGSSVLGNVSSKGHLQLQSLVERSAFINSTVSHKYTLRYH